MVIDAWVTMNDDFSEEGNIDIWGYAGALIGKDKADKGVEYNYCNDSSDGTKRCCSAFYKTTLAKCTNVLGSEDEILETDYGTCRPYDIDFSDPDWKKKLVMAGIEYAIDLFGEE